MSSGSGPGGAATPEFVTRVGSRIRRLRKARGWTMQQLVDESGVSRRMLTSVELGQANPSLATIDRIAAALGTDFATLALPEAVPSPGAVEPVAPTAVWRDEQGSEGVLLGATNHPRAELWKWQLTPGTRYQASPDALGAQEVHHVLTGRLTLELPSGQVVLDAGETATIPSDQPYAYVNDGAITTVFFRVLSGA